MSDWLNVGKIVNTHGIHGEVRLIANTDFPNERFAPGVRLSILNRDGSRTPVTVSSWRTHKQFDLLTFEEIQDVNEAERFKDSDLQIDASQLGDDELESNEYYFRDIIGLHVVSEDGEEIGTITEILTPGANDVWAVKQAKSGKEILIPYISDVVKHVDLEQGQVVIHLMEGLLDE
ncbi:ribosome maturation factor RimM [Salisediminibacterium halotolerans]|uniref:ribosome maturation factor RimM n=1 Tax=Salisediminibacterium halotolerans TaxID=517425 RepID=UPI000EB16208|nr:ribosome maturation factor RimM [Salisediminibacterium halotolerans]RLJ74245.1 16S rRNA processing protein RimM [Actinophytocola xinjiangensis]RPE87663.1 16S rRNA processing protein RimM [Salisediminibacterium halotolerans]TWG35082.1 16S rRNA processing protein RimM [Salisediminibacterium halotolerans]GEL06870.1 ribosome maturation factor RimM [Salisediminibacterium halotolerans]